MIIDKNQEFLLIEGNLLPISNAITNFVSHVMHTIVIWVGGDIVAKIVNNNN